jgi:hypothetical protein
VSVEDAVGNKNWNTTTVSSKIGDPELVVERSFGTVFEGQDLLYSNRTLNASLTDDCTSLNEGRGNVFSGEQVNFSLKQSGAHSLSTDQNSTVNGYATTVLESPLNRSLTTVEINATVDAAGGALVEKELMLYYEQKEYELEEGWNPISIPLYLDNSSVNRIEEGLEGADLEAVWGYDTETGSWDIYSPDKPNQTNTLSQLSAGTGYWVNVSGDGTLTINGSLAERKDPDETEDLAPNSIVLEDGWNFVGFRRWMDIQKFLSEFGISNVLEFNRAGQSEFIYTTEESDELMPGEGYWIDSNSTQSVAPGILR